MRKIQGSDDRDNEMVQVLGNGPIAEVQLPPVDGTDSMVKGSAVDNTTPADAPRPRWYRVTKGGVVLDTNGFRTRLNPGKELNTLNYNVRKLLQQGIMLEEFDPAVENASAMCYPG